MTTFDYFSLPSDFEELHAVVFWGAEGAEELQHESADDYIEWVISGTGELHGTMTVAAWRRMPLGDITRDMWASWALERLVNDIDEEHGDPNWSTRETDGMRAAARAFVDAVLAEYKVWACEIVALVEVDVHRWVQTHHPDWLEEPPEQRSLFGKEGEAHG